MDLTFMKQVSLFREFTPEELEIFACKLKPVKFKEGESIITEHEESDKLYILYTGKVVITKKMSMIDEQEEIDKTFLVFSGEDHMFFGEIGLLGFRKRTATAAAKTNCQLYTISQKDFIQICDSHPHIGYKVLLEISRKLAWMLERTNTDVLKLTTALIYALKR